MFWVKKIINFDVTKINYNNILITWNISYKYIYKNYSLRITKFLNAYLNKI